MIFIRKVGDFRFYWDIYMGRQGMISTLPPFKIRFAMSGIYSLNASKRSLSLLSILQ